MLKTEVDACIAQVEDSYRCFLAAWKGKLPDKYFTEQREAYSTILKFWHSLPAG